MSDTPDREVEWPREIWMAEREEHDQGVVRAVLSEHAKVARFEGDTERDREFHPYIDRDIYESQGRYYETMLKTARGETLALQVKLDAALRKLKEHSNGS